jgi:hypothetical protein
MRRISFVFCLGVATFVYGCQPGTAPQAPQAMSSNANLAAQTELLGDLFSVCAWYCGGLQASDCNGMVYSYDSHFGSPGGPAANGAPAPSCYGIQAGCISNCQQAVAAEQQQLYDTQAWKDLLTLQQSLQTQQQTIYNSQAWKDLQAQLQPIQMQEQQWQMQVQKMSIDAGLDPIGKYCRDNPSVPVPPSQLPAGVPGSGVYTPDTMCCSNSPVQCGYYGGMMAGSAMPYYGYLPGVAP